MQLQVHLIIAEKNSPEARIHREPAWIADYTISEGLSEEDGVVMMMLEDDPITFEEVVKSTETKRKAMLKEICSIEKNKAWEFTTLPKGVEAIGVQWIYKTKLNEKGEIEKHTSPGSWQRDMHNNMKLTI